MSLENYFTEENIVKILCKYRAIQAGKRHDLHMVRNYSINSQTNKILSTQKKTSFTEINDLFPTRRNWKKLHRNERNLCGNSVKSNELRLYNSYKKQKNEVEKKSHPEPIWYTKLVDYVRDIQNTILNINDSSYTLESPKIIGIKKDGKGGKITYRPIAVYGMKEKIICTLTARYFTAFFDKSFLNCSYAFRSRNSSNIVPSHHDCIKEILKKRKQNKQLWVAECDIQKFFDIVNHNHLKNVFEKLTNKLESEGKTLDKRSKIIFEQFLNSYSFQNNILVLNSNKHWFEENKLPYGNFGWVEDELNKTFGENYCLDNSIGVPQGNAISCFVANLILHDVDVNVLKSAEDIFYIRYCDDMILIHQEESKCQHALDVFMKSLIDNYLLFHKPIENVNYKKESDLFWNESKSKLPFKWDDKNISEYNVPWLSFVGYQINFNGKIRVRKKTIIKETKKQVFETEKIIRSLGKTSYYQNIKNEHSRWSKKQIKFSLHQRLISMSVGRIKIYNHKNPLQQGLCWTNGFKMLKNNKIVSKQLKYLDSRRRIQLKRLHFAINKIDKKSTNTTFTEEKLWYGSAFSYFNFLKHK